MRSSKDFPTWSKDKKVFHVRKKVTDVSPDFIEKLGEIFKKVSTEVFGKNVGTTLRVFKSACTCRFTILTKENQYDPDFMGIILTNLADAVVALSLFKNYEGIPNENKRKAKQYYSFYMNKQLVQINKIKEEYAKIFENRNSIHRNTP